MRRTPFAEVLRGKLDSGERRAATGPWSGRPATGPLFASWAAAPARRGQAAYASQQVPPPPSPEPPAVLGPEGRRAFAALNALGAGLGATVSIADVRRAFRRLARQLHPDRHPGCSIGERQRLSHRFAEMTSCSRALTAALQRAA